MTREELVALHGEEIAKLLERNTCLTELYKHGPEIFQKFHDQLICPILKMLGFSEVSGILEAKYRIEYLRRFVNETLEDE